MNTIELLLKVDAGKIELPQKEVEIKRLSDATGNPVIFKLQGIESSTMENLRDMADKENGYDMAEIKNGTILHGVKEPSFKDSKLHKHFGAATPYDLISKILLPGEIDTLYNEISKLSGYGEDAVQEVKN